MKETLLTIVALFFILAANAQETDSLKKAGSDTLVYAAPEHSPEFPGGVDAFLGYIAKNTRYPATAREASKQGKVIVQFIVEKDGTVSHVQVVRNVFPSLDAEAIRVVSGSPKWAPGSQDGYPVRVRYTVPISFNISNKVYILQN